MPRAVTAVETGPGFALYTLGRREAFTLLAVTFVIDDPGFVANDGVCVFDCLDASGGLIYRQMLGVVQYKPVQYSLSAFGTPWTVNFNFGERFPGPLESDTYPVVSASLPVLQLAGSCTVRAYACLFLQPPTVDLFADLQPEVTVPNLHLWVEDAAGDRSLPPNSPPLLTHLAA